MIERKVKERETETKREKRDRERERGIIFLSKKLGENDIGVQNGSWFSLPGRHTENSYFFVSQSHFDAQPSKLGK